MKVNTCESDRLRIAGRTLAIVGAATLTLGVGLAGCKRGGDAANVKAASAADKAATQVSVVPVTVAPISDTIEVTGALASLNDVTVGVKLAGKVTGVFVREGDPVRAGQIVAQEDPADYRAQLDQQLANLRTAQTKMDQAYVAHKNAQTNLILTKGQTIGAVRQARAALDAAKEQESVVKAGARPQELQQAQDQLDAAKADRDKARNDLKRYRDLYRQQAVSAQQLDQAQSTADSADARFSQAEHNLSLIKEGSRVQDIRRAEAATEQARQALAMAESNRDQIDMRRADIETARVGIQSAKAGVAQARAAVNLAQQALNDTAIRTPVSGVVAERKIEPGMQLAAAKDVLRIVDLDTIYFDAQLSEIQYSEVHVGMNVGVAVDALPGKQFQGAISKIYPVASSTARSFTVRISLKNEAHVLRPAMFARGKIVLSTHPGALLVPREAVLDNDGKSGRLFVVKNSLAEERKVKVGFSNLKDIEIVSGLSAEDRVVTVGQAQIQNGDKLQVLPANGSGSAPQQTSKLDP